MKKLLFGLQDDIVFTSAPVERRRSQSSEYGGRSGLAQPLWPQYVGGLHHVEKLGVHAVVDACVHRANSKCEHATDENIPEFFLCLKFLPLPSMGASISQLLLASLVLKSIQPARC